jgi:hypothetical protein
VLSHLVPLVLVVSALLLSLESVCIGVLYKILVLIDYSPSYATDPITDAACVAGALNAAVNTVSCLSFIML